MLATRPPIFSAFVLARGSFRSQLRVPLHSGVTSKMSRSVTTLSSLTKEQPDDDVDDVEFSSKYGARIINLNRPKKLNSLNGSMARKILPRLKEWEKSDLANVVIIKGSGRAFCAGGDIHALCEWNKEGTEGQKKSTDYFALEYNLDHTIATYQKPYVALMDGITMGGGVGLSIHAPFRIATENTVFAMPETTIGFFPEVGASFFLPRMDGNIGTYLALTSAQLRSVDVFYHGLATHFIHSTSIPALEQRLAELTFPDSMSFPQRLSVINSTIEEFVTGLPSKLPQINGALRVAIDQCFDPSRGIDHIFESLDLIAQSEASPNSLRDWAVKTAATIKDRSPIAVAVTLEQMRVSRSWNIAEVFVHEHAIASEFMKHHDFVEGVTSRIIDRKSERPDWKPNSLSDVKSEDVRKFFAPPTKSLELITTGPHTKFSESPYKNLALPSEVDILKFQGENSATVNQTIDHFVKSRDRKLGVAEKVMEVLQRTQILNRRSHA